MNGGQIYSWGENKLTFNKCWPNEKLKDIKITINELHKTYRNNLLVFGYGEDQKIYIIKDDAENFTRLKNELIKYENNEKTCVGTPWHYSSLVGFPSLIICVAQTFP